MYLNKYLLKGFHRVAKEEGFINIYSKYYIGFQEAEAQYKTTKRSSIHLPFKLSHILSMSLNNKLLVNQQVWRIGQKMRLFDLGQLGFFLYTCKKVPDAINQCINYNYLLGDFVVYSNERKKNQFVWQSTFNKELMGFSHDFISLLSLFDLSLRLNIIRRLANKRLIPENILISENYNNYKTLLFLKSNKYKNIKFSLKGNMLIFPSNEINIELQSFNSILNDRLPNFFTLHESKHCKTLSDVVTNYLLKNIGSYSFCIQNIAGEIGISVRSLQRKLQREGTNFNILLQKVRKAILYDLIEYDLSNREIARQLGYLEVNSFSRAFKAWHGMSLSEYKSFLNGNKTN